MSPNVVWRLLVATRDLAVRSRATWLLAIAVLWSAIVYRLILGNYFFADDFGHLFMIVNWPPLQYILEPKPGHLSYVPRALFYVLYNAFGPDPRWFFATVLATHLLNVALLFGIIRVFTGNEYLACLGAALWGSARIQEQTLGWYGVYGQVVATTLFLVVLYRLAHARQRATLSLAEATTWCALLLLACTCFGSGFAVAMIFPVVAWLVLPPEATSPRVRAALFSLPFLAALGYLVANECYAAAYGDRSGGRLWGFVAMSARYLPSNLMIVHLPRAGITALVSDVAAMPEAASVQSYAEPAAFVAVLVFVLLRSPPAVRRSLIALLLLSLSVYAVIGFGRFVMSPKNPAAGAFVPRYHYLATAPLTIALCLMIAWSLAALRCPRGCAAALLAVWLAGMGLLWGRGGWQIQQYEAIRQLTQGTLVKIRTAIEAAPGSGPVFIPNEPFRPYLPRPYGIGGWAGLFSIYAPSGGGRRVYFVEPRPEVRAMAPPGSPLAALFAPSN